MVRIRIEKESTIGEHAKRKTYCANVTIKDVAAERSSAERAAANRKRAAWSAFHDVGVR